MGNEKRNGIKRRNDASPVRKAFVLFTMGQLCPEALGLAFEGRLNPEDADRVIADFNEVIRSFAEDLPNKAFKPNDIMGDDFPAVSVRHGGENLVFASLGHYADWLSATDGDAVDASTWLEIYAGIIKAQFSPFAKLPSVSMLKRGFTTCRHYVPMQRGISEAFSVAKQGGALVYRLFQTMSEFHAAFAAKNVLGELDEMDEYSFLARALDTLPLCIADIGVASSVFSTILPIILASGVECDPREIFQYRAERGRRYLREFAGVDDDASIDVLRLCLREAIVRCPSRLLPYISCSERLSMLIRDCVDEIVEALIRNYEGAACLPCTDMILIFD